MGANLPMRKRTRVARQGNGNGAANAYYEKTYNYTAGLILATVSPAFLTTARSGSAPGQQLQDGWSGNCAVGVRRQTLMHLRALESESSRVTAPAS
jgi:hypothetical protein